MQIGIVIKFKYLLYVKENNNKQIIIIRRNIHSTAYRVRRKARDKIGVAILSNIKSKKL